MKIKNFRELMPVDKALITVLSEHLSLKKDKVYRFDAKRKSLIDISNNDIYPINGYNVFWQYYYPSETKPSYDDLMVENQKLRQEIELFKSINPKYPTL